MKQDHIPPCYRRNLPCWDPACLWCHTLEGATPAIVTPKVRAEGLTPAWHQRIPPAWYASSGHSGVDCAGGVEEKVRQHSVNLRTEM